MDKTQHQDDTPAEVTPAAAYQRRRTARRRTAKKAARKDAAAKATARSRKAARAVPSVPKAGPNPQIAEAQKALDKAKEAYAYAVDAIEGQYIKALIGVNEIAAVNALRRAYTQVPDAAIGPGKALAQPAGPRTKKKTARAKAKK